jgi:DNA-binding transcriptional MocR family regulator
MREHRELLRPKFDAMHRILDGQLGGTGLATWSTPRGGYFIAVNVLDGCAGEVVRRAAVVGIALTPAGVTHHYRDDPRDRTLRIAPSYPDLPELELAISGLATCIRLACYEKLAAAEGA